MPKKLYNYEKLTKTQRLFPILYLKIFMKMKHIVIWHYKIVQSNRQMPVATFR